MGIRAREEEVEEIDEWEAPVGMRVGRSGRGDEEAELGGDIEGVIAPAERESDRGLLESFRRQASLQYRMELLGV